MQINLRYKNIEARRFSKVKSSVNINNNSTVTSVTKKGENLEVNFVFTSRYEPNIGLVKIEGELLLKDSEKNINKIMEEWESSEEKNLPKDVAEGVHNTILSNCIVEATILSKEVQLPPPIPTPKVSMEEKEGQEEEFKTDYIR